MYFSETKIQWENECCNRETPNSPIFSPWQKKEQTLSPFRRILLRLAIWVISVRWTKLRCFKIPRLGASLPLITRRFRIPWMLIVVGLRVWPDNIGLSRALTVRCLIGCSSHGGICLNVPVLTRLVHPLRSWTRKVRTLVAMALGNKNGVWTVSRKVQWMASSIKWWLAKGIPSLSSRWAGKSALWTHQGRVDIRVCRPLHVNGFGRIVWADVFKWRGFLRPLWKGLEKMGVVVSRIRCRRGGIEWDVFARDTVVDATGTRSLLFVWRTTLG